MTRNDSPKNTTRRRSGKSGLPPGALVHVGTEHSKPPVISIFDYSEQELKEFYHASIEEIEHCNARETVTWINVDGVHDAALIGKIGEIFGLHSLIIEDILNTEQRPKKDDMGGYLHLSLKMLYLDPKRENIIVEHVSLVVGNTYVISFQEGGEDVFQAVRERLRGGKGRLRKRGADYLAYALVDSIVDNYFPVLEFFGDRLEHLEEDLVNRPSPQVLKELYHVKRALLQIRRAVWPIRDIVGSLSKLETNLITDATDLYLRDLYHHVIELIDILENYREIQSGMLDIYLSSLSNRMNSIMQFLAIITTIFMPLTFIAGVYGMNFKHMPELNSQWGYPLTLIGMGVVVLGMVGWFRKKRWI